VKKNIAVQIGAATGACAVIAAAAIGVMATRDGQDSGLVAKTEPTEITQTTQVAPSEPEVPSASPSLTGPAPLPTEEQGVPG
jgi:hypothetical protein